MPPDEPLEMIPMSEFFNLLLQITIVFRVKTIVVVNMVVLGFIPPLQWCLHRLRVFQELFFFIYKKILVLVMFKGVNSDIRRGSSGRSFLLCHGDLRVEADSSRSYLNLLCVFSLTRDHCLRDNILVGSQEHRRHHANDLSTNYKKKQKNLSIVMKAYILHAIDEFRARFGSH